MNVGGPKNFKVGFLNATSLKKHMWQFQQSLLNGSSYDLFGVAESRLGPEVDDCLINVQGYSAIRQYIIDML